MVPFPIDFGIVLCKFKTKLVRGGKMAETLYIERNVFDIEAITIHAGKQENSILVNLVILATKYLMHINRDENIYFNIFTIKETVKKNMKVEEYTVNTSITNKEIFITHFFLGVLVCVKTFYLLLSDILVCLWN